MASHKTAARCTDRTDDDAPSERETAEDEVRLLVGADLWPETALRSRALLARWPDSKLAARALRLAELQLERLPPTLTRLRVTLALAAPGPLATQNLLAKPQPALAPRPKPAPKHIQRASPLATKQRDWRVTVEHHLAPAEELCDQRPSPSPIATQLAGDGRRLVLATDAGRWILVRILDREAMRITTQVLLRAPVPPGLLTAELRDDTVWLVGDRGSTIEICTKPWRTLSYQHDPATTATTTARALAPSGPTDEPRASAYLAAMRTADAHLAARQSAGALRALDRELIWSLDEIQSLGRIADAVLRRSPHGVDASARAVMMVARFCAAHARGPDEQREVPFPDGSWSGARLDELAQRATAWLDAR